MKVLPLKKGIIYGPVDSRRLGKSLGINLSPVEHKLCSFNCIYCHYGWTERVTKDAAKHIEDFPKKEDVFTALRQAIKLDREVDYITFSGDGEPTLHPEFEEIVCEVRKIRDELVPGTPIAVLSNSSMLFTESVRRAVSMIDLKMLKLDAGIERIFREINKPVSGLHLNYIVDALKGVEDFLIQTLFVKGVVDNTVEENLAQWIKILSSIKPRSVQIYSTDRPVPEQGIEKVSREGLEQIALRVKKETGIQVEVFSLE